MGTCLSKRALMGLGTFMGCNQRRTNVMVISLEQILSLGVVLLAVLLLLALHTWMSAGGWCLMYFEWVASLLVTIQRSSLCIMMKQHM
jgi:hypothetical protein